MLKEAILELRDEVLALAEENEQRTMQKCAQTLMAATGLKMLQSRMEKTALSKELLERAAVSARKRGHALAAKVVGPGGKLKGTAYERMLDSNEAVKKLLQSKKFERASEAKHIPGEG